MHRLILVLGAGMIAAGCRVQPLTAEEARAALDESAVASQAAALVGASVEVSTDFTIGGAVEQAAGEVRDFVRSQLPCAEVGLQDATLRIQYGAHDGNCVFRGHRFDGEHTIAVERNDEDDIVVQHEWDDFNNGRISVSGHAQVTWSASQRSRRVVHELTWTRISDGRMGVGSGDRVQTPLAGGVLEGIEVNGTRAWDGDRGHWGLDIDGVQMRWVDPVPQAGSWTLETPFDKVVGLGFERVDEDSIAVTVEGGDRSIELQINSLGVVSRR